MYFNSYPGLTVYHNSFKDKGIRVVYTLPPFKRPRYFDEYPGTSALSNHPIQGTSADIQKLAMAMMYEQLHSLGYSPTQSHDMRQICTIHDEIVSEALPHLAEECAAIQESCMVGAAKFILEHCPIDAAVHPIANLAMK
jgi:DNA polymerase-1